MQLISFICGRSLKRRMPTPRRRNQLLTKQQGQNSVAQSVPTKGYAKAIPVKHDVKNAAAKRYASTRIFSKKSTSGM
jgi:hypothetical protein